MELTVGLQEASGPQERDGKEDPDLEGYGVDRVSPAIDGAN